ncbi:MAG TPA: hypothetical protein VIS06_03815 [Mycobacteriales bacterium]
MLTAVGGSVAHADSTVPSPVAGVPAPVAPDGVAGEAAGRVVGSVGSVGSVDSDRGAPDFPSGGPDLLSATLSRSAAMAVPTGAVPTRAVETALSPTGSTHDTTDTADTADTAERATGSVVGLLARVVTEVRDLVPPGPVDVGPAHRPVGAVGAVGSTGSTGSTGPDTGAPGAPSRHTGHAAPTHGPGRIGSPSRAAIDGSDRHPRHGQQPVPPSSRSGQQAPAEGGCGQCHSGGGAAGLPVTALSSAVPVGRHGRFPTLRVAAGRAAGEPTVSPD